MSKKEVTDARDHRVAGEMTAPLLWVRSRRSSVAFQVDGLAVGDEGAPRLDRQRAVQRQRVVSSRTMRLAPPSWLFTVRL